MMETVESLFSLRGHVGLVTGASSGLGVECAHALAMAGADVAIAARRGERVEKIAAELEEQYGIRAIGVKTDITVDADLDRLLNTAYERSALRPISPSMPTSTACSERPRKRLASSISWSTTRVYRRPDGRNICRAKSGMPRWRPT